MTACPHPLTPPDADLQDFAFMPLHVSRLRDSDLAAEERPEACWYAVMLWAASWHQLPAGSLPDNDVVLARLAGLGRDLRTWKRNRDGALRGFILCTDGRLYHPVVAEQVISAWTEKLAYRDRKTKRKEIARNAAEARWHIEASADADAQPMHEASIDDASCMLDAMLKGRGRGTGTGSDSNDDERERCEIVSPKPETWPPPGDPGKGLSGQLGGVLDAAGIPLDPSDRRWAGELQRLKGWLERGCDFETEILPAVDRALKRLPVDDNLSTLKPVERELFANRARSRVAKPTAAPAPPIDVEVAGEPPAITEWRSRVLAGLGTATYRNWVARLSAALVDGELVLNAPSRFHAARVEAEYRHVFERAVAAELSWLIRIVAAEDVNRAA